MPPAPLAVVVDAEEPSQVAVAEDAAAGEPAEEEVVSARVVDAERSPRIGRRWTRTAVLRRTLTALVVHVLRRLVETTAARRRGRRMG